MNHTLSHRELYDLVWARPMVKVAAEFGIFDVGLNKICKRHRVPVPGRGYWAKLAAGKKVAKAPFRELADERLKSGRHSEKSGKQFASRGHRSSHKGKVHNRGSNSDQSR